MIIVRIRTNNVFRVVRKYEKRPSRLMIMNSLQDPDQFQLTYVLDEPTDY